MFNMIKKVVSKQLVKQAVKVISKNNPYALAAVELYGMYELMTDKEKEGRLSAGARKGEGKVKPAKK